jgi:TrmH family RNA methyltransferase
VAEGEDLLDAAEARGWQPRALVAAGSGLDGERVAPHCCARSPSSARARARSASTASAGRRAGGPLCVALWGVNDPGNVGTVLRSRARVRRRQRRARARARADPYGHKAVRASMGALFSVPSARVREVGELPGRRVALVAARGRPLRELEPRRRHARGRRGARGPAGRGRRGVRRGRHIPIALGVAERRHGGDVALYE